VCQSSIRRPAALLGRPNHQRTPDERCKLEYAIRDSRNAYALPVLDNPLENAASAPCSDPDEQGTSITRGTSPLVQQTANNALSLSKTKSGGYRRM